MLDEPTTGLHFEDIRKLLEVLQRLVDTGNTVLVIEHNLDVIKTADWIVDLGPEGGDQGGTVVVAGTPEDVAAHPISHTGRFLQEVLGGRPVRGRRRRARLSGLASIPADMHRRALLILATVGLIATGCSLDHDPRGRLRNGHVSSPSWSIRRTTWGRATRSR